MELPSTKPYLLRAIWEWCCDNGFTPYIAVEVDARTRVPREFVRDGQIVLNIGPDASNKLQIGNDFIEFQARFGGVARDCRCRSSGFRQSTRARTAPAWPSRSEAASRCAGR
jgi:stringent starvation protein B